MPPQARMTDKVIQDGPHCHAPIHPPAPVPTPVPHPPMPLTLISPCASTVLVNKLMAVRLTDMTTPCMLPGCVPAGPGMVAKGSGTVIISGEPIDAATQDVIRTALQSAGHDSDVTFIDREVHADGEKHVKIIKKHKHVEVKD